MLSNSLLCQPSIPLGLCYPPSGMLNQDPLPAFDHGTLLPWDQDRLLTLDYDTSVPSEAFPDALTSSSTVSTIFADILDVFDSSDFKFTLASALYLPEPVPLSIPAQNPLPLPSSLSLPVSSAVAATHETVERDPPLDQAIPRSETTSQPEHAMTSYNETTSQPELTSPHNEATNQPQLLEAPIIEIAYLNHHECFPHTSSILSHSPATAQGSSTIMLTDVLLFAVTVISLTFTIVCWILHVICWTFNIILWILDVAMATYATSYALASRFITIYCEAYAIAGGLIRVS